jgi:hypothetical protein
VDKPRSWTYHDLLASPPLLVAVDEGVGNGDDGTAHKRRRGEGQQPIEQQLLRVRDVIGDGSLHKVARRVRRGQRLACGAGGGGFDDIRIIIRREDAARGEGGEEED